MIIKLGLRGRAQGVMVAYESGLVEPKGDLDRKRGAPVTTSGVRIGSLPTGTDARVEARCLSAKR